MASLSDIEGAGADLLASLFPDRVLVRGWFGEAPPPGRPCVYYRSQVTSSPDILPVNIDPSDHTQVVSAPASNIAFQVCFLGADAYADAVTLWQSMWLSQRSADLLASCGLMGVSMPLDLTALELGATQRRADMTVNLSASLTLVALGETIGSVGVRVREVPHSFDHTTTIQEGTPP